MARRARCRLLIKDYCSGGRVDVSRAMLIQHEFCDKTLELLGGTAGDPHMPQYIALHVESMNVFERKCTPWTWKATLPPSTMRYISSHGKTFAMATHAHEWMETL